MRRYGWDTCYCYNDFGANEHYVVTLYRLNNSGTKWKEVDSWWFSTFLSPGIAHRRAENRIMKLKKIYNAGPI